MPIPIGTYNVSCDGLGDHRVQLLGGPKNRFSVDAPVAAASDTGPNQQIAIQGVVGAPAVNIFSVQAVPAVNQANEGEGTPTFIIGQGAPAQYKVVQAPGVEPGQFLIREAHAANGVGLVWTAVPGGAGAPALIELQSEAAAPAARNANQLWRFVYIGP